MNSATAKMITDEAGATSSAGSESTVNERLLQRWLIVFILTGLIWRLVRFVVAMPFWGDEAMLGLNVIDRSYRELLQPLKYFQVAPFGFLWMLRFTFNWLGISDYTTRLPALAAGIISLWLFWQWTKLLVSREAAVLAVGIFAVSGYIVRHGVEMKPYSMDMLAAIVLLLCATQYLVGRRLGWLIALIAVAPICAVISYPQVFVAAGIAVALLVDAAHADWRHRGLTVFYCFVSGMSFLAVLAISGRGQYDAVAAGMVPYWQGGFPPGNPFRFILWFLQIHTGNLFAYPLGGRYVASLFTVILFWVGLFAMWKKWPGSIRLMLLLPFGLTFLAAVFRLYPYGERVRISQHLAPMIILLAGAGVAVLIDAAPSLADWRRRLTFAGILLVGIALVHMTGNVVWPYKIKADQDMRTAMRKLWATAGDDPVFLTQPSNEGVPTLFWYAREGPHGVTYGLTPSADVLSDVGSAWVITCHPSRVPIALELARQAHMNSSRWLSQDIQVGPREQAPMRFEIYHLLR